jgi:hypothetical protein
MPATSAGAEWQGMADVTTTTTEETGGATVSELAKTIQRLELWAEYWLPHYPAEFIADLQTLIGTAKAALQVAETLENAERIMIMHEDDEEESYAVPSQDVDGAIETLLGGSDE